MTFHALYEQVLRLKEVDPSTWGGSSAQQEEVADAMSRRLRECWETTMWSRILELSEETVTTDADGAKYVAFGGGVHEEDAVWHVYKRNPRVYRNHGRFAFLLTSRGIELTSLVTGSTVWVEHRPRAPELTRVAYAGGTTYGVDAVVYDATTGECYRSVQAANTGNAVTDTDWWALQEIPYFMGEFVKRGAFSDLLRNDGRGDRADVEDARARQELLRIRMTEESQQAQHRKIVVTQ